MRLSYDEFIVALHNEVRPGDGLYYHSKQKPSMYSVLDLSRNRLKEGEGKTMFDGATMPETMLHLMNAGVVALDKYITVANFSSIKVFTLQVRARGSFSTHLYMRFPDPRAELMLMLDLNRDMADRAIYLLEKIAKVYALLEEFDLMVQIDQAIKALKVVEQEAKPVIDEDACSHV